MVGFALVGVPLAAGAYYLAINAALKEDPALAVKGACFSAVFAVPGALTWLFGGRRPGDWAMYAIYVNVWTALGLAFPMVFFVALGEENPWRWLIVGAGLLAMPLILVASSALAARAARMLTLPVSAAMADSSYHWPIPLRGLRRTMLVVGTKVIEVRRQSIPVLDFFDIDHHSGGTKYPLTKVTWVWDATTNGEAPATLPKALKVDVETISGPAVGLRVDGHEWVLPVDRPAEVVALLQRRIERANAAADTSRAPR
jgi:hypothetical protein